MTIYLIQFSSLLITAISGNKQRKLSQQPTNKINNQQMATKMSSTIKQQQLDLTSESTEDDANYDRQFVNYDYGDPNDCIDEDELMACVQKCENNLMNEECRREAYLMQCYGQCTKGKYLTGFKLN